MAESSTRSSQHEPLSVNDHVAEKAIMKMSRGEEETVLREPMEAPGSFPECAVTGDGHGLVEPCHVSRSSSHLLLVTFPAATHTTFELVIFRIKSDSAALTGRCRLSTHQQISSSRCSPACSLCVALKLLSSSSLA